MPKRHYVYVGLAAISGALLLDASNNRAPDTETTVVKLDATSTVQPVAKPAVPAPHQVTQDAKTAEQACIIYHKKAPLAGAGAALDGCDQESQAQSLPAQSAADAAFYAAEDAKDRAPVRHSRISCDKYGCHKL